MHRMDTTTKGTITAISAFFLWGIFPIYWKALKHVPSTQILAHRVVWSLVFILVLVSVQRRWKEVNSIISFSRNVPRFLFTSFLLGTNWLIYIWAVNTNQIVEASLGYFINPLVNVCLGMVFLRERLYRWQVISVVLAFIGVLFLTLHYGRVPWIAFTLAFTFGHGARRIQYSTVGFLQYIAPTGQLLVGVFLYKELFTRTHAISFGFVWVAIIIYSISSFISYKKGLTL